MATHVMTTDEFARANGRRREASTLLTWLKNTASKIAESWDWCRNYQLTVRELERLTDKELDDIGILRLDIPTIAMRSAAAAQDARLASSHTS